jgi:RNA helicase
MFGRFGDHNMDECSLPEDLPRSLTTAPPTGGRSGRDNPHAIDLTASSDDELSLSDLPDMGLMNEELYSVDGSMSEGGTDATDPVIAHPLAGPIKEQLSACVFTQWFPPDVRHTGTEADILALRSDVEKHYAALVPGKFSYLLGGLEKGQDLKGWHIQGYLQLPKGSKMRYNTIRAKLQLDGYPAVWLRSANGTVEDNHAYCTKDKPASLVIEYGTSRELDPKARAKAAGSAASRATAAAWEDTRKKAKEGNFDEIAAKHYVPYLGNIERINFKASGAGLVDIADLNNWWIWGAPGTGKSMLARWLVTFFVSKGDVEKRNEPYFKPAGTKWWDHYGNQHFVIWDDLEEDGGYMKHEIKRVCDHYPVMVEAKGASKMIRPLYNVVTSNYTIDTVWSKDAMCAAAVKRRFFSLELCDLEEAKKWFTTGRYREMRLGGSVKISNARIELNMPVISTAAAVAPGFQGP